MLLGVTVLAVFFPRVITIPLTILGAWMAIALLVKAYKLWFGEDKPRARHPLSEAVSRPVNDAQYPER